MKVAITGSSGLIGTALTSALRASQHDVIRLVRSSPEAPDEVAWDPAGELDPATLEAVDAVVNLAAASVADYRSSRAYRRADRRSRVDASRSVATAMAAMDKPPPVLVSASAISIYGTGHGADVLDEDATGGAGYRAETYRECEAAADPARAAGVSVRHARIGVVISPDAGVLARMVPLFRAGLGGPWGGGEQFWSIVSLDDTVRALQFMTETVGLTGAYNVTAPLPVRNAEFARVLALELRRPAIVPLPAGLLRLGLGGLADDVLGSLRVIPRRLSMSGFEFAQPDARSMVHAARG